MSSRLPPPRDIALDTVLSCFPLVIIDPYKNGYKKKYPDVSSRSNSTTISMAPFRLEANTTNYQDEYDYLLYLRAYVSSYYEQIYRFVALRDFRLKMKPADDWVDFKKGNIYEICLPGLLAYSANTTYTLDYMIFADDSHNIIHKLENTSHMYNKSYNPYKGTIPNTTSEPWWNFAYKAN